MDTQKTTKPKDTSHNGFASMDRNLQREIARKGGISVSRNREWMSKIGKMGGIASGKARAKEVTHDQ